MRQHVVAAVTHFNSLTSGNIWKTDFLSHINIIRFCDIRFFALYQSKYIILCFFFPSSLIFSMAQIICWDRCFLHCFTLGTWGAKAQRHMFANLCISIHPYIQMCAINTSFAHARVCQICTHNVPNSRQNTGAGHMYIWICVWSSESGMRSLNYWTHLHGLTWWWVSKLVSCPFISIYSCPVIPSDCPAGSPVHRVLGKVNKVNHSVVTIHFCGFSAKFWSSSRHNQGIKQVVWTGCQDMNK